VSNIIEVGSWDKLPHYAVVGRPVNFYVWICLSKPHHFDRAQGASEWISGAGAFAAHTKLRNLAAKGRKSEFIDMIKELHKSNRKQD
jgi:hypothetical protein